MAQHPIPYSPYQGQLTPDDGWRRNWPKLCVQTNIEDSDESLTNYSIHINSTSAQSLHKTYEHWSHA